MLKISKKWLPAGLWWCTITIRAPVGARKVEEKLSPFRLTGLRNKWWCFHQGEAE